MSEGEAILSADAASDTRFETSQSIVDFRIRSMMCAPLTNQAGKALGLIYVDTQDARSHFQQEDLDVLVSAATQAARAVENANLHRDLAEQERMRRELEFAAEVQRGFLPTAQPEVANYHFYDFYEAARRIGGDYYDYIPLPGDRLAVTLGDVAGKGVAAALLMARLSAEVRFCLASVPDPAEAINRLNLSLSASGMEDRFVTFLLAVLDLKANNVVLVNAGHMEPLLRRRGSKEVLPLGTEEAGLPLAVAPEVPLRPTTVPLQSGDRVVLFTDGVTEAMNPKGDLYGMKRLEETILAAPDDVEGLGSAILADVRHFAAGRAQNDDITLVCFGRTE
jgi:serine phosphatase RsbU (regulator of sigma subunit)